MPTKPTVPSFSLDLEGGVRLDVVLEKTARGSVVRAEERVAGRVVGTIDASQVALQRVLGIVQRASQPENAWRNRPVDRTTGLGDPDAGPSL